jgi:hypothetical protein
MTVMMLFNNPERSIERAITVSQIHSAMAKSVVSLRSRFLASAADSPSVAEMKACYSNQVPSPPLASYSLCALG